MTIVWIHFVLLFVLNIINYFNATFLIPSGMTDGAFVARYGLCAQRSNKPRTWHPFLWWNPTTSTWSIGFSVITMRRRRRRRLPRRGYFQCVRIVSITRPWGRGEKMCVLARSGGSRRRRRIRGAIGNAGFGRFYNEDERRKSRTFSTGHSIGTGRPRVDGWKA